ncbi:membrane-associated protein [Agrilactobacillus composti DSM 18527 = JCM 14202]|uniref:Membrane-associated protein n=1 Tax=Agrilactobacillus composti DSM 18527 = JCM 14202 TaxID=1423734 RepID=A0A0R1XXL9_9LACO|nr:VTT domain-containing protein [Agrilactobacillus composti]KRM34783.1 membrane-associated protein [Agrilactobacillus composti DSM 18527 = JCM 14202]
MAQLIDFILHIDQHLVTLVNNFGNWSYVILFAMVFIETGIVIFPFLPGDSLLFASAALAANPAYHLNNGVLFIVFLAAAVIGDTVNYEIGRHLSDRALDNSFFGRFINRDKLAVAEDFFDRHGGKTIAIARFVPIVRTFAPFVSGGSHMNYRHFILYNFIGGFLWVTLCVGMGHFFGNIPFVKDHFSMVAMGIVAISLLPMLFVWLRNKLKKKPVNESAD